jgi:Transposase IS4
MCRALTPPSLPVRYINEDERSRNLLLDDEVSEINEFQLPNDSQGDYVDEGTLIRPVTVPQLVKPAFKNNYNWFTVDEEEDIDTNGSLPPMKWRFVGTDAGFMEPKDNMSDSKRTPLEYFLASMPPASLKRILHKTNEKLRDQEADEMGIAELLRFFGVCILVTRMQFGRRRKLWGLTTGSKYIPSANFMATGMSRNRFEDIWSMLSFSHQEPKQPINMSSADYRWTLVDDFVDDFNRHRRARFRPSEKVNAAAIATLSNITIPDLYR